ncbi:DUF3822 family protein [Gillisia sp. M10.2A]|uniref:DUF3822 family protein n=1 Tax=Gillisia lutea TaxID=2909668 RepID=A0ABS9EF11_9FLAO|nr:DUF3822 family protein [Gillisia lutea]MCF4101447.1 DUF3822 family protein [Gillisia lutea]
MSIQVSLNGLSFCTLNCADHSVIWYKKIKFKKEYNPVKILEQIELLFASEEELKRSIDEVVLLFSNDLYSLVPGEYFIEEDASNYLKFNTKILKTDIVAQDHILDSTLVNVYIPYTNITNFLFDKYGEFEYKHTVSVLIESVINLHKNNSVNLYLNNNDGYFDLVVVKNNTLLLANTFSYDTKEDFIYYLLFTAEQLELDTSKLHLWLLGNITKESSLYSITYTYIKNIDFLLCNFDLSAETHSTQEFQREAFTLINSIKCE